MHISSNFDSGNIEVVKLDKADDIQLTIRKDNKSDFFQWFHFRLTGAEGKSCRFRILNAGDAAYAEGWHGYRTCASYDRENWFRIDTEYDGKELVFSLTPEEDSVYLAYFAPYSMERHHDLIATALESPLVRLEVLGQTLDGQDLDLLRIGDTPDKELNLWFHARQHPGETMAEWWMEGFLERLLDPNDPVSRKLLERCRVFVVPNLNPDGSRRGHLRTNAAGANLNREWKEPSMDRSPEVYLLRQKMHDIGVDFHLDVHGDEAIPANFIAGYEGIPNLTKPLSRVLEDFKNRLALISPDFQTKLGYPVDKPNTSDLRKCTDYVANSFGCLAMTLEMPFKDNDELPDALYGWSPERCKKLAHASLDTVYQMLDDIKGARST